MDSRRRPVCLGEGAHGLVVVLVLVNLHLGAGLVEAAQQLGRLALSQEDAWGPLGNNTVARTLTMYGSVLLVSKPHCAPPPPPADFGGNF
jgi:hypothetical protein